MARKKDAPSPMDIAIAMMSEHFGKSKTQVAKWGLTVKIAKLIDEAEERGAENAESNEFVAMLMAPVGEDTEPEVVKPSKKEEKAETPVVEESKPAAKKNSTFGGSSLLDLPEAGEENPVPGSN
jgi:hypothetical protein